MAGDEHPKKATAAEAATVRKTLRVGIVHFIMLLIKLHLRFVNGLGPKMGFPKVNAEPPGSQPCGAIAGRLIQAAGKSALRVQQMTPAPTSGQPPSNDTLHR